MRNALAASRFNWGVVPVDVAIRIKRGIISHAQPGEIWLDANLLNAGRFGWATVQDEFAHQVDFFVLTPAMRAKLQRALGAKAWCYENAAVRAHRDQGCERFSSLLPWAYWQSPDNAYRPTSERDESAAMPPARFRTLLAALLGAHVSRR